MVESFDREKSLEREIRAFHWVRLLAQLPGRLAGTADECEAADRVESWFVDLGVEEVSRMPVTSRPRPGLIMGFSLGLGALGCWWGGFFGAALAVLAAWSFRREIRGAAPLIARALPASVSLNVVARAGAREPARRVVLSAHIDTAQAGWIFAGRVVEGFARRAQPEAAVPRRAAGPAALPEGLLVAGAAVAVAAWLGAEGFLIGSARLLVGAALAAGCVASLQWAWAGPTPGAGDNASGVAAMLTCAEQLLAQLPEDAELWVVGTGAEEVGCRGMHAFLDAHRDWRADATYFVNFECVGGGALHYARTEGTHKGVTHSPTLVELARRVAASGVFGEVTAADLLAGTDAQVPAARGFPALSLISLEASGVPRNYHRPGDVPESLEMSTVVRAADFGAAVARAALEGKAGPIAIL